MSVNNILNIIIPGQPQAKQRSRKGAHGNWYNPQEKEEHETKKEIKKQLSENFVIIPSGIPVRCNMTFFFQLPKSILQSKKKLVMYAEDDIPCLNKKDIDNCHKFFMDSMNEIIWHDDNQVYSSLIEKYYSEKPRTEIEIIW